MREAVSSPTCRPPWTYPARRASGARANRNRGDVMALVHDGGKRKLRQGDIALGFGLHHLRGSAAPLLAAAGAHDYLFMDMEHGAFTVQEATQICIASCTVKAPCSMSMNR